MPRKNEFPDDPKRHLHLSVRQSIIEVLENEGGDSISNTIEGLVENFLMGRDFIAKRFVRRANELKEDFGRINKNFTFQITDTPPKQLETTSKPEDEGVLKEKNILKNDK